MPRRCPICRVSIAEKRADASTCGAARCRKALYRAKSVTVAIEHPIAFDFDGESDAFDVSPEIQELIDDDRERFARMYPPTGGSAKHRVARKAASKAAKDVTRQRRYDRIESTH